MGKYQAIVVNCSCKKWRAEGLASLPVHNLAAQNAAVFLWCPSSRMQQAMELLRCWGFEYHDVLRTHMAMDRPGSVQLQSHLPLLIVGVRGDVLQRCTQGRTRSYVCLQESAVTLQQTLRYVDAFLDVKARVVAGAEQPHGEWDAWSDKEGLCMSMP